VNLSEQEGLWWTTASAIARAAAGRATVCLQERRSGGSFFAWE